MHSGGKSLGTAYSYSAPDQSRKPVLRTERSRYPADTSTPTCSHTARSLKPDSFASFAVDGKIFRPAALPCMVMQWATCLAVGGSVLRMM
jgi:hypothetical protein